MKMSMILMSCFLFISIHGWGAKFNRFNNWKYCILNLFFENLQLVQGTPRVMLLCTRVVMVTLATLIITLIITMMVPWWWGWSGRMRETAPCVRMMMTAALERCVWRQETPVSHDNALNLPVQLFRIWSVHGKIQVPGHRWWRRAGWPMCGHWRLWPGTVLCEEHEDNVKTGEETWWQSVLIQSFV